MNKLILFLIRRKLGVKKYQRFYFKNQVDKSNRYFITDKCIVKEFKLDKYASRESSNIRLNFLLSEEAKELIVKV